MISRREGRRERGKEYNLKESFFGNKNGKQEFLQSSVHNQGGILKTDEEWCDSKVKCLFKTHLKRGKSYDELFKPNLTFFYTNTL